jgi:3-oxoacyl-[acyl-carrier-protein] synthase-1
MPLLLAVPEPWPDLPNPAEPDFFQRLSSQAEVPLDASASRLYLSGRAGGLEALADAMTLLDSHRFPTVLVGGVDSYDDVPLLRALVDEGRLVASGPSDRWIPGEGASLLMLGRTGRRASVPVLGRVLSVGRGFERGHLYSREPYLGEGLAQAVAATFASAPQGLAKVACVYASFNGEGFWAKEWGVALLRSRTRFAEGVRIEHPADGFGDLGAAFGPSLVALAAIGMGRGYRKDPCLVFCSSDRGARAAALVCKAST